MAFCEKKNDEFSEKEKKNSNGQKIRYVNFYFLLQIYISV